MPSRLRFLAIPLMVGLVASLGLTSTTRAAGDDTLPAQSDRYELLSRLEPYHYPARYITAFENNKRQAFATSDSDTTGPLARKPTYASEQAFQEVRQQVLNDYGMLKLGYIWIVAITPDSDTAGAAQHYFLNMHDLLEKYCDPDPLHNASRLDPNGRYRIASQCRSGDVRYTEITADPIGDFSVLRGKHGGGTLVSWVIAQSASLHPSEIGIIRKKLPHGYYMVFADTLKTMNGAEMKIVRVYKDGDERGYSMPLPPEFH